MKLIKVKCAFCGKEFFKTVRRVNEAKKFGWKYYCSLKCQSLTKNKQKVFKCGNSACNKTFKRQPKEIPPSGICFCSNRCAAIANNSSRRKVKICPTCDKQFYGERKYCSNLCRPKPPGLPFGYQRVNRKQIISEIQEFYKKNGRIPVKREYHQYYRHYYAARLRFGTWNKAIETAGFEPNPVMFAKKHIANDGHICDSFAEKIIDDWLYSNDVEHQRKIPYPNSPYTADFLVKGKLVEFLGLNGEIKQYDKNTKLKEKLAEKHKLKLIKIFPKDLFPINHLSEIIKI